MGPVKKFSEEYYTVAFDGADTIPVLLTLADDRAEGQFWSDKQLQELVEMTNKRKVPLPFDPAQVELLDRAAFLERIGDAAVNSSAFTTWYAFSRIAFFRRRISAALNSMILLPPPEALQHDVALLGRLWLNLEDTLDACSRMPFSGEEHEPGVECLTCSGLSSCEKGQHHMLDHNPYANKPIWN
jgi:hypothetical protein